MKIYGRDGKYEERRRRLSWSRQRIRCETDTDRILSIGRYVLTVAGSSSTVFKYDTVDKKEGILITLPSLFKDNSYIEIISENIKDQ